MLKDIIEARIEKNYEVRLRFEDGVQGIVDLADEIEFNGVFAPLRDPGFFASLRVDPDLGTICWPNGADLDPDVLYARVSGAALPRASSGKA